MRGLTILLTLLATETSFAQVAANDPKPAIPVTVGNFVRAESDIYFERLVKRGLFGKLGHFRQMVPIENQDVVRVNRDTLYSGGVFDLDAAPLTITLPDAGKRYMSLQVVSQDHFTSKAAHAPGTLTYTRETVGTRYAYIIIRTFADPRDVNDLKAANALQDQIKVEQASIGKFEVPNWDQTSLAKVRDAVSLLATMGGNVGLMYGSKGEVNPVGHLIGASLGWGALIPADARYTSNFPKQNDGTTIHKLKVKNVPVDGFWSVTVYNAKGYLEKNDLNVYSLNNLTAQADGDGAYTIQFGGCQQAQANCLPTMPAWNYMVRFYQPRKEILEGTWNFPEALPQ
jgi:hypothetical protein